MPVMPQDVQEETAKAETGFALMVEDDYELELIEVQTTKDGEPLIGKQGQYWTFVFQVPEDAAQYRKKRFWVNFSFSEKAAPIRKSILDALGVDASTDTDDMIGLRAWAHVHTKLIDNPSKPEQHGEPKDDIKYFIAKGKAPGAAEPAAKGKEAKTSSDNF